MEPKTLSLVSSKDLRVWKKHILTETLTHEKWKLLQLFFNEGKQRERQTIVTQKPFLYLPFSLIKDLKSYSYRSYKNTLQKGHESRVKFT